MATAEQEAQFDALYLVFGEIRTRLQLKPEDFPIALARVNRGSDGTRYQEQYVPTLRRLIGLD